MHDGNYLVKYPQSQLLPMQISCPLPSVFGRHSTFGICSGKHRNPVQQNPLGQDKSPGLQNKSFLSNDFVIWVTDSSVVEKLVVLSVDNVFPQVVKIQIRDNILNSIAGRKIKL